MEDEEPHLEEQAKRTKLLLLNDTALPLGSFAFSSGLESSVQHASVDLLQYLRLSLLNLKQSTMPFLVKAFENGRDSEGELDELFDSTVTCDVLRRASVAQGRAFATVSARALHMPLKLLHYHYCIVHGQIYSLLGLRLEECIHAFLLSHTKGIVSASVRLGIVGPYRAQEILFSNELLEWIRKSALHIPAVEDAASAWPWGDVVQSRHTLLYSRVFNS